ncbi:class I SAM-dependent methyltransferase [Aliiroseovarius subalbicans]|uniref:SAM-dependent methyltransferase n=1 Tax=Aliiroseovarius subalbicans TaxID=2925840 RepID=UPI001F591657|nr:class I SAM-dependent methyltransferase [Aliiroseovarius subalbicans]MCI2397865.1 class I SAM-dependent methyltransferase [Aliiroseovarius subalbicans]
MWDKRFQGEEYLFGTDPATFLVDQVRHLTPGARALAVADGEGRNSVFLAERGLEVLAMDASPVGVEKARKLAQDRGVEVDFRVADITQWDWDAEQHDLIVAVFIQFMGPALRDAVFAGMKRALRPGGTLLLHGYTPEQLGHGTGGPGQVENLYTEALLADAFADFRIERLTAYERHMDEGRGHSGLSALIDLVAHKPV